jgi:hypothetical protein
VLSYLNVYGMMQHAHQVWCNKPFITMAASPFNQSSKHDIMKFDFLPTVLMIQVFVGMVHCRIVNSYRHFGRVYRFHLQGKANQEEHLTDIARTICRNDKALHYYCYIQDTATKISVSNNSFLLLVAACYNGVNELLCLWN